MIEIWQRVFNFLSLLEDAPNMTSLAAPGYTFAKDLFLYLRKKKKWVQKIEENLQSLRDEVKYVDGFRKDKEEEAERNATTKKWTHNGKYVVDQCMKKVDKLKEIEIKYEREKSRKFKYFFALAKLSKDIKIEKMNDVARLIDKMKIGEFFTSKRPEPFDLMLAEDISDLPSLDEKAKELLRYLKDESVRNIGIFGPPGIGLTALLKNLNHELKRLHDQSNQAIPHNQSPFDMVIWVTVGIEKSAISKIQKAIAEKLEIIVGDGNEQVAINISRELERKRYLLILDDVHSHVDLTKVGINTDRHKQGKVVMATTNDYVLKTMKLDQDIKVPRLSDDDAWNLFKKYVGDDVLSKPIKYIAKRIVRELGGLPLVIKTMGLHMKDEQKEDVWQSKLTALQSYIKSDDCELQGLAGVYFMYDGVYNELSTDSKKCLLYGALFPQDYDISTYYLIETWRAERFIPDIRRPELAGDHQLYREARDKGYQIMQDLTKTCMLDECATMECVKMPKIFRKMALGLPYPQEEDGKVLVRAGEGIDQHPVEKEWSDAKRVSLMCNKLHCLPDNPRCSKISTLLLQWNKLLKSIEDSFFSEMKELRVLDLSQTGIKQLPLHVCRLTNLQGLYLTGCDGLSSIPADIRNLIYLEVLDICGTAIQYLPIEIQYLVCLKCLRFSFTRNVDSTNNRVDSSGVVGDHFWNRWFNRTPRETHKEIVPPNLVNRLCKLEELTIIVDQMDQGWNAIADGIAKEVASLIALTTLCFNFPNINSLGTFVKESRSWKNQNTLKDPFFRSFNFQIGYHERHHSYGSDLRQNSHERHLKLSTGDPTASAVRDVLKHANTFELIGHKTVMNLSDFGMEYVKELEVCVIEACNKMVSIIADNGDVAVPRLQKLHIINLQLLECIQTVPVTENSFSKLTILTLKGCPVLSKILTPGISHALKQLQHLRVENCGNISSVIEANNNESVGEITSEEDNLSGALPKLEKLELVGLPALVSICQNTSLDWLSLVQIEVRDCGALRHLSLTATNAQQLRLIECNEVWWTALTTLEQAVKERLNQFCCFIPEEDYETPPETPTGNGGGEPHDNLQLPTMM